MIMFHVFSEAFKTAGSERRRVIEHFGVVFEKKLSENYTIEQKNTLDQLNYMPGDGS